MRQLLKNRAGFHLLEKNARDRLARSFQGDLTGLGARELDIKVAEILGLAWTPPSVDTRVRTALMALQGSRFSLESESLADLAANLNLSPSRLRHLFREQVGMSLQNYRLWQRLFTALQLSGEGLSLTEAAHAAGFSDSAHLSRVFKRSFGLKPSDIMNSRYVQVFTHTGPLG